MLNEEYKERERVRLLLRIIPIVSKIDRFAIHGGTAINLFCRIYLVMRKQDCPSLNM